MAEGPRPSVYTIPVNRVFADALAIGLVRQHGGDPLGLARGMLLLPNHRAVGAVRDAFIREVGGAALLPRLVVIGDADLDEMAGAALDRADADADPPPPVVDPLQRRLILGRLIRASGHQLAGSVSAVEAVRLADSLARVLDGLAFEEVPLSALAQLGEDGLVAEHWESALTLLQLLGSEWPAELARLGVIDRAELRNRLLGATAARWAQQGLPRPWVTAAGITTAAPAIARLLRVIAFAEGGSVVLPHIDLGMSAADWDLLGDDPRAAVEGRESVAPLDIHPQYHLKLLLGRMGIGRGEVEIWPDRSPRDGPEERRAFLSHLLAPASRTVDWPDVPAAERRLTGVSFHDCADPASEALTIALAMRETLEQPGKTAALVTPDRIIAARVAAHLSRWGITADDSAGQPLSATPPGALMLALAQAAESGFAPVELLALLGHPLVESTDEGARRLWLDRVRELDLSLRGPRPAMGLAAIGALLDRQAAQRNRYPLLGDWWADASQRLTAAALALDANAPATLGHALTGLRASLTALAGDAAWLGHAGRALAAFLERLTAFAPEFGGTVQPGEVAALLRLLMDDIAVRPPQGGHPRLFIWGLLEARLQRADRMILAGLNEGQWPQLPQPDAWLSPGLRRRLGLPGLERQIGLAAHDFASALGAAEVIVTRSLREGSAPTIASRLRLRIDALTGGRHRAPADRPDYAALAQALDATDIARPADRPAPAPPVALRPRRMSVTAADTLLADPYSWYAQQVLGLRALDPLDADPTPAWRGTRVHDVLEQWLKTGNWRPDAVEALAAGLLAEAGVSPVLRTLWGPRLIAPLRWAVSELVRLRGEGRLPILAASEQRGAADIAGITLSGKADRIDRLADGTLAVVDYKTGSSPKKSAVEALFALQLGLLGALAQAGAFTDADGTVSTFEYWRLNKSKDQFGQIDSPFVKATSVKTPDIDAGNFVAAAVARLASAVDELVLAPGPFLAKRVPEYAPYADYDQLMRFEEWYGRDAGPAAGEGAA